MRKIHTNTFIRRASTGVPVQLKIRIGEVQSGEWTIWRDSQLVQRGTDTDVAIELGDTDALYGHVIQIEVRCDDTNPATDRLTALIALAPSSLQVEWQTDNAGSESPHGMMTSIAEIIILPVLP